MKRRGIKILYWIFIVAGTMVILAGLYLILRNLGVI